MKNWQKLMIAAFIVIGANGCTAVKGFEDVEALNEFHAVGSPFTQALAAEYRNFSNYELDRMYDHPDALHFTRKGLAAAQGTPVLPEPVTDWNLSPEYILELGTARGELINILNSGAREIAPKEAAIAQVKFDCWVEQQEERWQKGDIAACKSRFYEALKALDLALHPAPESEIITAPPAVAADLAGQPASNTAVMKPGDAMYLVFFDFDSSVLGSSGEKVIEAVAGEISKQKLDGVTIVGHADSSGPQAYNSKLSLRRADAVKKALMARGVPEALIKTDGRGEDDLLVKTPDGVREPANRRAQITFQ